MQIGVEVEIAAALPADISLYHTTLRLSKFRQFPIRITGSKGGGGITLISKFGFNLSGML